MITSSVLLMRYAQQKLREWQEREAKEFFERTRKQQHFESTERTCNQTILSLMANLNETLAKTVNTEAVVEELRKRPENKVELWEKLKVHNRLIFKGFYSRRVVDFGVRSCLLFNLFNFDVSGSVENTAKYYWRSFV